MIVDQETISEGFVHHQASNEGTFVPDSIKRKDQDFEYRCDHLFFDMIENVILPRHAFYQKAQPSLHVLLSRIQPFHMTYLEGRIRCRSQNLKFLDSHFVWYHRVNLQQTTSTIFDG
ncbi:unnamed protein product [Vicia faba]|uniref:Uncharacterized protein n=1 Tax=Vicia faba TaxID=3906 RepID=A0AAV0ZDT2_VICFA|nr:unnamed protein product [Vicia faba]